MGRGDIRSQCSLALYWKMCTLVYTDIGVGEYIPLFYASLPPQFVHMSLRSTCAQTSQQVMFSLHQSCLPAAPSYLFCPSPAECLQERVIVAAVEIAKIKILI